MAYFSLEQSTYTLNGTVLTGWSDDSDALEIPTLEIATVKRGADGKMIASTTGNKGGPVSHKFLANSDSVVFLSNIAEQQKQGARVVFNGKIINHETGASLTLSTGILTSYPPFPSLGKGEVSNLIYVIEYQQINGNFESANFNA